MDLHKLYSIVSFQKQEWMDNYVSMMQNSGLLIYNGTPGQFSIILTGIHEIGHGLGIRHSQFKNSIMYPYYNNAIDNLRPDDIAAIQSIYGQN